MGAGPLLRRLDRKVLPPLARILHRLGRGAVRLRVLSVVAIVAVVAVLVVAVWTTDRPQGSDPTIGQVVKVGVVEGQSIPAYVQASKDELAALVAAPPTGDPELYALVTLAAYLAPDRLTPVFGGVTVAQVFARVPLPGTQTEIVRIPAYRIPADVVNGMEAVAASKLAEAVEYQRLAAQLTGDAEKERHLRDVYTSGARVAAAEATGYRERCACVYAVVVRASPAVLQGIAARPEVRAVDPALDVKRIDRAVFLPPLPEQDGVAHPPQDSGAGPTTAPTSGVPLPPDPVTSPTAAPAPTGEPAPTTQPEPTVPPEPSGPAPSPEADSPGMGEQHPGAAPGS